MGGRHFKRRMPPNPTRKALNKSAQGLLSACRVSDANCHSRSRDCDSTAISNGLQRRVTDPIKEGQRGYVRLIGIESVCSFGYCLVRDVSRRLRRHSRR